MECPKVTLLLFAIRNPQVVDRALQKVTGFTRFLLRVCNPVRVTTVSRKRLKASVQLKEGPVYDTTSLSLVFIHRRRSTEEHSISCVLKALHKPRFNPDAVPISFPSIC